MAVGVEAATAEDLAQAGDGGLEAFGPAAIRGCGDLHLQLGERAPLGDRVAESSVNSV